MNSIIEVNEEEAISITIQNGFDGLEFETSTWKQRGCLKPNGTLKKLISKLETIYNHVQVTGNGKKRKYILKDKKETVTERIFNYKGSVPTDKDEIMKEYIFNKLVNFENEYTQSYKGWAKIFDFPDMESYPVEKMINEIKTLHYGFPKIYNPKEVVSEFTKTISTRNKDVIENSFKHLQKENRIKVTTIYNVHTIDGEYEEVDETEYNEIQDDIKQYVESFGITYYTYTQSVISINKSKKLKSIIRKVNNYQKENYGIKNLFKTFRVKVLNVNTVQKEINKEEFIDAYYKRLIQLTINRQNKDTYKNSLQFWKRFYLLNTLTLLEYLNVHQVDELLEEEKKHQFEKTSKFDSDWTIHEMQKNDKQRYTFGSIEINETLDSLFG